MKRFHKDSEWQPLRLAFAGWLLLLLGSISVGCAEPATESPQTVTPTSGESDTADQDNAADTQGDQKGTPE